MNLTTEVEVKDLVVGNVYIYVGALYKVIEKTSDTITILRVNSRTRFKKKLNYVKGFYLPAKDDLVKVKKTYLRRINKINLAIADVDHAMRPYEEELIIDAIRLEVKTKNKNDER